MSIRTVIQGNMEMVRRHARSVQLSRLVSTCIGSGTGGQAAG